jgi:ankyrin repeat protein
MVEKDYMRGSFGILDPYFLPWLHPFFVAVFQRLQPEVTRLLAAGADPNMERPNGATPLDWAVRLKEIDLVRLLLAQGADPNHRDSTGATPFIRAGVMGAGNLVLLLLAHGGDPTIQDQSGITVLYGIAANCNRDGDTVHLLDTLVAAGADPCPQDPSGWTVLHSAARHDPEVVAFLIAHGCDVNARWEFNGETPLLKAIQQDQLESVQMLLQAGADPNAQSYEGAIPLVKALWQSCEYQTLEVCQLLLEYGADLDLPNCNGMTARRYMREALREGRTCYPEREAFLRRYA